MSLDPVDLRDRMRSMVTLAIEGFANSNIETVDFNMVATNTGGFTPEEAGVLLALAVIDIYNLCNIAANMRDLSPAEFWTMYLLTMAERDTE